MRIVIVVAFSFCRASVDAIFENDIQRRAFGIVVCVKLNSQDKQM